MIIKSYEIKRKKFGPNEESLFLLYGENFGLKKEIKDLITSKIKQENENVEILSLYENEVINKEENFFSLFYNGSLFGNKRIIYIYEATHKIFKKIEEVFNKNLKNVFLIVLSEILDKKSKLRNFFEKEKKTICIPCYLDNEKDLTVIAQMELKKNNITLSRE